jgi:hypothetical protein
VGRIHNFTNAEEWHKSITFPSDFIYTQIKSCKNECGITGESHRLEIMHTEFLPHSFWQEQEWFGDAEWHCSKQLPSHQQLEERMSSHLSLSFAVETQKRSILGHKSVKVKKVFWRFAFTSIARLGAGGGGGLPLDCHSLVLLPAAAPSPPPLQEDWGGGSQTLILVCGKHVPDTDEFRLTLLLCLNNCELINVEEEEEQQNPTLDAMASLLFWRYSGMSFASRRSYACLLAFGLLRWSNWSTIG